MNALQACSGEKIHTVQTGTIKRLIHRYLQYRSERRALRRGGAENKIMAPYEGRRWCDETERELIADITNSYGSHLWMWDSGFARTSACAQSQYVRAFPGRSAAR
jgi:hypothetical protein